MNQEKYKKLNLIIKEYNDFLIKKDPFLHKNLNFFINLSSNLNNKKITNDSYFIESEYIDSFSNLKISESIEIIRDFYNEINPKLNINQILDNILRDGTLNIFYEDEIEEYYDELQFNSFPYCGKVGGRISINLPLNGKTRDILLISHELRHYLNEPENIDRTHFNNILTESLSITDEFLLFDYLKKIDFDESEINKLKKERFIFTKKRSYNLHFISQLLNIVDKLGQINKDNYLLYYKDEERYNNFSNECEHFLDYLENGYLMNIEKDYYYVFGIFLASYMHQEYLNDSSFINKYNQLNDYLKVTDNLDCLNLIDIDLLKPSGIQKLIDSLNLEIININEKEKAL